MAIKTTMGGIIGGNLTRLLEKHGLKQADIVRQSDGHLDDGQLSKIRAGKIDNPGVRTLQRIAIILNEPLAALLEDTEDTETVGLPAPSVYYMKQYGASDEFARLLDHLVTSLVERERGGEPVSAPDEAVTTPTRKIRLTAPDTLVDALMDELVTGMVGPKARTEEERDDSLDKLIPHWKRLTKEQRTMIISLASQIR